MALSAGEARPRSERKRKVAMLLGFSGEGTHGLCEQADPSLSAAYPTVERAVRLALAREGLVSAENAGSLRKVGWSRSSRTDAGVHAAGLVVACKVLLRDTGDEAAERRVMEETAARINRALPDAVRVFGVRRVSRSFCARSFARARRYEYLLPADRFPPASDPVWAACFAPFLGTRSVHNFTASHRSNAGGVPPVPPREAERAFDGVHEWRDHPRLLRRLEWFDVDEVECGGGGGGGSGARFLRVRLQGASFVFHQVRKMVGLAAAAALGACDGPAAAAAALSPLRVSTPLAPAGHLVLDRPPEGAFDDFRPGRPPSIEVAPADAEALERFKRSALYPAVAASAARPEFGQWLCELEEWGAAYGRAELPRLAAEAARLDEAMAPERAERARRRAFFEERDKERAAAAAVRSLGSGGGGKR